MPQLGDFADKDLARENEISEWQLVLVYDGHRRL